MSLCTALEKSNLRPKCSANRQVFTYVLVKDFTYTLIFPHLVLIDYRPEVARAYSKLLGTVGGNVCLLLCNFRVELWAYRHLMLGSHIRGKMSCLLSYSFVLYVFLGSIV